MNWLRAQTRNIRNLKTYQKVLLAIIVIAILYMIYSNKSTVVGGKNKVIALFYAPWCGHCKKLMPIWDKLTGELNGNDDERPKLVKINCDENAQVAEAHNIQGYPTIKYLPNGLDGGANSDVDYEGDRSYGDIKEFYSKWATPYLTRSSN